MSHTGRLLDDFDVVTATIDGGVIWKRFRNGKVVVTLSDQTPQEVLAREQKRREADALRDPSTSNNF